MNRRLIVEQEDGIVFQKTFVNIDNEDQFIEFDSQHRFLEVEMGQDKLGFSKVMSYRFEEVSEDAPEA